LLPAHLNKSPEITVFGIIRVEPVSPLIATLFKYHCPALLDVKVSPFRGIPLIITPELAAEPLIIGNIIN
jgi:hypothetical protein